jgi:uncharacterized membrane protein YeaQ/YmgE (transglycosylase-associated protein family)
MIGSIIYSLIIGLVIGAIARFLIPGRDSMGCLATALLGIGGSFIGGIIGHLIWGSPSGVGFHYRPGIILSVVGAMLLLLIWRQIRGK